MTEYEIKTHLLRIAGILMGLEEQGLQVEAKVKINDVAYKYCSTIDLVNFVPTTNSITSTEVGILKSLVEREEEDLDAAAIKLNQRLDSLKKLKSWLNDE